MVQHQYTELIFGLNALFKPAAYENESKCPVLSPFNELFNQMSDDFDVDFFSLLYFSLVCYILGNAVTELWYLGREDSDSSQDDEEEMEIS